VSDDGGAPGDGSAAEGGGGDAKLPQGDGAPTNCVPVTGQADAGLGTCNGTDAKPPPPSDSGPDSGTGTACVALDSVGTFTPTYKPPSGAHQGKCTQQQIDDFRRFCLGTGDQQACQTFLAKAEGKACAQCIVSPPSGPTLGPLIDHAAQGFVSVNTTGCVALLEPCNEQCAKDITALSQCDDAACVSCKVTDPASLQALNACTQAADNCACRDYALKGACGELLVGPDHPAAKCFSGATFDDGYNVLVPLFCGP
jgi:hypothetical protein